MKKYITHFILCAILLLAGCFLLFYVWVVISLSGYPLYIRHAFVLLKLEGNYFLPSMDGATALYPVYAAFA